MKIGDIIAKMVKKEELTEDDLKFLKEYKEQKPVDVEKLNKQITDLQTQFNEVKKERDELSAKAEESASAGQTEAQKLQKQLEKAQTDLKKAAEERDEALSAKSGLEYDNAVSALAAEHKFTDRDFLRYKFQTAKVDPKDPEAAKAFLESLKKEDSKFFATDIKPGAGPKDPPQAPPPAQEPNPGDRIGGIMKGLESAPEAK